MNKIRLEQVYKTSGFPEHTFVKPREYNKLLISLRTPGRCSVIEGPSGIGKTTCVTKILTELGESHKILSGRNPQHLDEIRQIPLSQPQGYIVIDDFHRLNEEIKHSIADYMKSLADSEDPTRKLVAVGINKAGKVLIDFAGDLTSRLDTIKFEANPEEKIEEMITKGETALNISISIKSEISENAHGSFQIAHALCQQACIEANILESLDEKIDIKSSFEHIKESVIDNLATTFFPKAKKFASGKRIRPEGRAPYLMLLHWLSNSDEWSISIDEVLAQNPKNKGSVGQIVDKGFLAEHIAENDDLDGVVHFDSTSKILAIEDPKFMFYIKNIPWSRFCKQIGFRNIEFKCKYDFALSFAGEIRGIAENIFNKLAERELEVFYDFNEQHRILAANVEEYLAPIYRSESEFVLALLSPQYPKKVWTKFESNVFKTRFGENGVIPIFIGTEPSAFDITSNVGGFFINPSDDIEPQLENLIENLCEKIKEERNLDAESDQTLV